MDDREGCSCCSWCSSRSWRRDRVRILFVVIAMHATLIAGTRPLAAQGPATVEPPAPRMVRTDAVETLGQLCRQRAVNIQAMAGNVQALKALKPQLEARQKDVATAAVELGGAQRNAVAVRTALQVAQGPAADNLRRQLNGASRVVDEKQKNLRKAQEQLQAFVRERVEPLNVKIAAAWQDMMVIYVRMRELVPTNRQDPEVKAVADAFARECANQQDFVEGYVLGAITAIYRDDVPTATDSLDKAARIIVDFNLYGMLVAADYCYACLLLGRPDACQRVVDFIKKMDNPATSIEQDCAVGLHAYATRKFHTGATFYVRASHKQARVKRGVNWDAPPALWGEAAVLLFHLEELHQKQRARDLLAKDLVQQSGAWQVLRARAMLHAEGGQWNDAVGLLTTSMERAPLVMRDELADQLNAYAKQEPWDVRRFRPTATALAGAAAGESPSGGLPKCVLRERVEALKRAGDMSSQDTLEAIETALEDRDLTLDDMDWAEQQFNDDVSIESLEGDGQRRYRRYLEFTRDELTKHEW